MSFEKIFRLNKTAFFDISKYARKSSDHPHYSYCNGDSEAVQIHGEMFFCKNHHSLAMDYNDTLIIEGNKILTLKPTRILCKPLNAICQSFAQLTH